MTKQLRDYVKQELNKGTDVEVLKYQLQRVGWPEEDVDKAIKQLTFAKSSKKYLLIVFGFITVVLISVLIFTALQFLDFEREPEPTPIAEEEPSCEEINVNDKHECYLEELRQGFNCNVIESDEERIHCLRALEYMIIHDS